MYLHFCHCMQNNCVLFNNCRKVEAWHMQLAQAKPTDYRIIMVSF